MVSLTAYKVLHLFSIVLTFTVLGGLALHAANGGDRESNGLRKLTGMLHGLGLVLILVSGMGALARLGMSGGFPGWVWAKMAIWLVVGASAMVFRRSPRLSKQLLWLLPVLAGVDSPPGTVDDALAELRAASATLCHSREILE